MSRYNSFPRKIVSACLEDPLDAAAVAVYCPKCGSTEYTRQCEEEPYFYTNPWYSHCEGCNYTSEEDV